MNNFFDAIGIDLGILVVMLMVLVLVLIVLVLNVSLDCTGRDVVTICL